MTVNELIDKLESVSIRLLGKETEQAGRAIILYRESAIMLRQQQTELDAFKLNYYNTGYSLQLRDKDETICQQKDRINVLEANHKIQLKINKKALEYIKKLEKENENLKERDRVNSLLFNQIF